MLKRTITVLVGLPIVLLLVHLGGLPLIIFCAVVALVGLRELYVALSGKNEKIHLAGYLFTIAYFAAIYLSGSGYVLLIMLTIFIIVAQSCLVIFFKKMTLKDCISTVYGVLYIPFLLSFIVLVREHSLGQYYVWLIFTSAFGCDTFAYLTGSSIGKRKLKGTPSPGKTVEGIIGGIIGAALVGCLYGFVIVNFSNYKEAGFILDATIISAVGAVFCIVGDMAASAIKRNTGIKDFGNLFPGHGGVLDRIDSIVVAAPIVYMVMNVMIYATGSSGNAGVPI